jgi:hypothetical protein
MLKECRKQITTWESILLILLIILIVPELDDIEGRVIVKFVVNEDGSISDTRVVEGVSKELMRKRSEVVKNMPKWKPGFQNGIPVKHFLHCQWFLNLPIDVLVFMESFGFFIYT